jgi:colanic acid/amylovoran biosynthesis glycosyltransferase
MQLSGDAPCQSKNSNPVTMTHKQLSICIATNGTVKVSETFIQAHLERLTGRILHISAHGAEYHSDGQPLALLTAPIMPRWLDRCLNVLPRLVEFRVRRRWFAPAPETESLVSFLRSREIDVVLAEYGQTGANIWKACERAGVKLVTHFHGFDISKHSVVHSMTQRYREMFAYCSKVIAVSHRMRQDLIALGCPEEKICLNPYGPHPDFFGVSPNYESSNLLMLGRLTEKKAPHLTLLAFSQALSHCPGMKLRILGDGELRGVCRDLAYSLNLSEHVVFKGSANRSQVLEEMRNAFAFVQHSVEAYNGDSEGTPVAILEAGAAGLPVIATRHAGIPDVVVPGATGVLVSERDVQEMANAMVSLFRYRKDCRTMGENARQRIQRYFSMDKHIEQLNQVLVDCCARQLCGRQS